MGGALVWPPVWPDPLPAPHPDRFEVYSIRGGTAWGIFKAPDCADATVWPLEQARAWIRNEHDQEPIEFLDIEWSGDPDAEDQ
jgi:hypothetical protein